jgi:predicted esterase
MSDAPLLRHAATRFHGRYVVRPSRSRRSDLWFVGFHGQGQTAEGFLAPLERVPRGADWLVAAVQGLNRSYAGRTQEIVATWMTSQDRELAIADNILWVDTVLDRLEQEFGPPRAIVFAGFSQGVAMAYRAGLFCRRISLGVVACCGDVPPELMSAETRPWPRSWPPPAPATLVHAGASPPMRSSFARAPDVDVRVFEGGTCGRMR